MERVLDELNHPLLFVLFMLLALGGFAAVSTHIFKRLGWSGPAAFMQHP